MSNSKNSSPKAPPPVDTSPLVVYALTKDYGKKRVLNNVSFSIQPGEIFGLLGPNGAGKTTAISTIMTLIKATSGHVSIFGQDLAGNSRFARSNIGYVPQELIHHSYFNVEEILNFHSYYQGIPKNKKRIHYLLKRLELFTHRHKPVSHLSGGMKRRVLIAKALVHNPKILILDEPTAGVDVELKFTLWAFISELKKEGVAILFTTHYLEEAEKLCDRIGILEEGNLHTISETQALIEKCSKKEITLTLAKTKKLKHPALIEQKGPVCVFAVSHDVSFGALLKELPLSLEDIEDVDIKEGNLEDIFRKIMKTNKGDAL